MRHLSAILLIALLGATASDSWGQSKQNPPSTGKQDASQPERGSEKSPVVVKVLPTEKTKPELDAEKEKQESDRQLVSLTGDLAKYTKALFLATGVLGFITAGLVIVGYRQTRDAKHQLKHAREAERAYLFGGIDFGKNSIGQESSVFITVSNHGKTPGYITVMDIQICKPADLPKLPDFTKCDVTLNLSIGPGVEKLRTRKEFAYPDCAAKIIYGCIHYRDIFGDPHTSCFVTQPMPSGTIHTVEASMAGPEYTAWT